MKVAGINAYNGFAMQSKNNVHFGRFADQNADDKIKELLGDSYTCYGTYYDLTKDEPSIIIYTAPDRTLQGRFLSGAV